MTTGKDRTVRMTRSEALEVLNNGAWWNYLNHGHEENEAVGYLHAALDVAMADMQEMEKRGELQSRPGGFYMDNEGIYVPPNPAAWVDVKSGLPAVALVTNQIEVTDVVLATDGKWRYYGYFTRYRYDGSWIFIGTDEDMNQIRTKSITHWQSLPELPKEGSGRA